MEPTPSYAKRDDHKIYDAHDVSATGVRIHVRLDDSLRRETFEHLRAALQAKPRKLGKAWVFVVSGLAVATLACLAAAYRMAPRRASSIDLTFEHLARAFVDPSTARSKIPYVSHEEAPSYEASP